MSAPTSQYQERPAVTRAGLDAKGSKSSTAPTPPRPLALPKRRDDMLDDIVSGRRYAYVAQKHKILVSNAGASATGGTPFALPDARDSQDQSIP